MVGHQFGFEVVSLLSSLVEVTKLLLLSLQLLLLQLHGFVSLRASDWVLVLRIGHVVLLICSLHGSQLLLIAIANRSDCGRRLLLLIHFVIVVLFSPYPHLLQVCVFEDLLLRLLDHLFLVRHLLSLPVYVVDKLFIHHGLVVFEFIRLPIFLVNQLLSLVCEQFLLIPVVFHLVTILGSFRFNCS